METTTDRVPQSRLVRTEIPGPRSRQLMAPARTQRSPPGWERRWVCSWPGPAGGIIEDVDGNRLIDLASGISVTNVGNSAPRVVAAVSEQVELLHPHVLPGDAVPRLRRGVRAPQPS